MFTMQWWIICVSTLGIFPLIAYSFQAQYNGDQVLQFIPADSEQVEFLRQLVENEWIDLWKPQFPEGIQPQGEVHARIPASSLDTVKGELKERALQYSILTQNIQDLLDRQIQSEDKQRFNSRAHEYTKYHPMEEIYHWMEQMKENYKELVTQHLLGVTYEKRPMYYLKISRKSDRPKKIIWMDCGIHAREWIAPAFCQWFVREVLETYTADPNTDRFLEHIDFYILPVLNIDGYVYSWLKDRLWRKSRSPCANSTCFGTDLNRNYDAKWCSIGASRNCCSTIHCGSAPESEPETIAVAGFIRKSLPDILCYLTIHSYGQLILIPYGYTNTTASNHEEMMRVGKKAADALEQKHGTKFKVGPSSLILYYLSGSSQDWAGDLQIDFNYMIELRDNGTYHFILPENQIQPTCEETMAAVTTIIEHIYDKHFPNAAPAVVALWWGVLTSCFLSMYFVNLL
ncbi:carboxypeptidase O-like [Scyliorhinus canicula]|uniref:carboxypeptidase O-like n=1 Tax=Scyliorhinus canicula TaxID=7830 RepID=UPI0018F50580|nr:carboxypeptidase O-like [Scyliorhinus canicula]